MTNGVSSGPPGATGPLVGRRAPELLDLPGLPDLPRLRELTRSGRPLLLDPDGTLDLGPWSSRVERATLPGLGTALLLRPDCFVAWQGDPESPGATAAGLHEAPAAWFVPDNPAVPTV